MLSTTLWTAALAAFQLTAPVVAQSQNDPCRIVAKSQLEAASKITIQKTGDILLAPFDAETAFKCATSVPLDNDEAATTIQILKLYYGLQTTIPYLKNPPKSYQQPAVDVMGRFDAIADKIKKKTYKNQYELDIDINSIIIDTHEGHFQFAAGVIQIFQWILPDSLVTISSDGKAIPQVYTYSDVYNKVPNASPVVEIEGETVFNYLRNYTSRTNALGLVDPHADYNAMNLNPAYQFGISGASTGLSYYFNSFQSTYVYNGKSLKGRFANGTNFEWEYVAGSSANLTASGWLSGDSIYSRKIVNRQALSGRTDIDDEDVVPVPEEELPSLQNLVRGRGVTINTRATTSLTKVPFDSYPSSPDTKQDSFGFGGTVSGYILKDASIGVLSLPSFANGKDAPGPTFSDAVADFISKAKSANVKKIVIDLSGNGGGSVFQGYDTFRQFFPTVAPTLAFRTRSSDLTNTYGSFLTSVSTDSGRVFSQNYILAIAKTFGNVASLNSAFTTKTDGSRWSSWKDFYGPNDVYGDKYTNLGYYNLSSTLIASDLGQYVTGYGSSSTPKQPFDAKDIILLHDGHCASTCTIFSELMKVDGGVKSVAVGGIPQNGPMQGVSGTRGSNLQKLDLYSAITENIVEAAASFSNRDTFLKTTGLSTSAIQSLPKTLAEAPWTMTGGVNALDEIRLSSPNDPRQFVYEASNCRIFYTGDMVRDVTQLWIAAGKYANGDTSVCVPGSQDAPGSGRNKTVTDYPGFSHDEVWDKANSTAVPSVSGGGDQEDSSSSAGSAVRVGLAGVLGLAVAATVLL
ncbi:unnamed protein product [Clonostachys rosea f. rosea IK726]|uniref:Uncharacterized protein n=1 Tax=Clonostachys rosea f. rosea IK726 TaxID=1349383 RepID=A0ACA9TZU4_BIOOC|nr:unnamed protein product [Clonostachys rosea f. rosea IK726]